jgi:hypothetical protein
MSRSHAMTHFAYYVSRSKHVPIFFLDFVTNALPFVRTVETVFLCRSKWLETTYTKPPFVSYSTILFHVIVVMSTKKSKCHALGTSWQVSFLWFVQELCQKVNLYFVLFVRFITLCYRLLFCSWWSRIYKNVF